MKKSEYRISRKSLLVIARMLCNAAIQGLAFCLFPQAIKNILKHFHDEFILDKDS